MAIANTRDEPVRENSWNDGANEQEQRQTVSSAVSFHLQSAHTICHARVYTARKSQNGRLLLFFFSVSLFLMFLHCDCVTLCVAMGETCVLMFVSVSACVCSGARSSPLRRSEAGSWPKLKGMTVTFGQNQEQSVFCLYCFLRSSVFLSSQPRFPSPALLSSPLSVFPQNRGTETHRKKNKERATAF